ncbi:MAG: GtrA family protein [Hyphomicrobiaceae bacterium]|nr:GtrA family protein [Hyphomicrobiaceae bacterium]
MTAAEPTSTRHTPARYLIVGLACALLHNAILIGLDRLAVHYIVSSAVSFVACVAVGYLLHTRYTFSVAAGLASLWRYTVAMAANLPLSIGLLFAMVDVLSIPVVVAAPATTILMFAWNYLASRWAIVRPARSAQP